MIRSATLAALLAFLPVAPTASEERGSLRAFSDWVIGCDNGRACHALGLLPAEGWFLRLDGAAAASAPVSLRLMPQSEAFPGHLHEQDE